jgi:3-hydroxyisobutyrate dehydrogenase-like beta-hydroxyacid dehydrogenase
MHTLTVPNAAEVQSTIRECLATLPMGAMEESKRAKIANNCIGPMVLLVEALHLAGTAGPDEEAVMLQFIRRLYAQTEMARRKTYFANLMQRLSAHRPLH